MYATKFSLFSGISPLSYEKIRPFFPKSRKKPPFQNCPSARNGIIGNFPCCFCGLLIQCESIICYISVTYTVPDPPPLPDSVQRRRYFFASPAAPSPQRCTSPCPELPSSVQHFPSSRPIHPRAVAHPRTPNCPLSCTAAPSHVPPKTRFLLLS